MKNQDRGFRIAAHIVLAIMSLLALLPFILLVIGSFTDNAWAIANGYSFFPKEWSLKAYEYIAQQWSTIGRAYLVTIFVTILGTALGLVLSSMLAYALSRPELPGRGILMVFVVITMLFNGGIVASYFIWTQIFHIKNTIWALIFPNLLANAFNIILLKNYFENDVPRALLESAFLDGAGELKTFFSIVLPLSMPILATVGLMSALAYWNDWTNGLYYLSEKGGSQYYSIQLILNSMNNNIQFLANNAADLAKAGMTGADLPSTTVRMAIAVVGILPILAAYPFFQKYFVKGITIGAVKG